MPACMWYVCLGNVNQKYVFTMMDSAPTHVNDFILKIKIWWPTLVLTTVWISQLLFSFPELSGPTFDFDVMLQYFFNGNKILDSANYDSEICLAQHAISLSQRVQTVSACGYSNFTAVNVRRIREIGSSSVSNWNFCYWKVKKFTEINFSIW